MKSAGRMSLIISGLLIYTLFYGAIDFNQLIKDKKYSDAELYCETQAPKKKIDLYKILAEAYLNDADYEKAGVYYSKAGDKASLAALADKCLASIESSTPSFSAIQPRRLSNAFEIINSLAVSPDGNSLYYFQVREKANYVSYNDIYYYNLKTDTTSKIGDSGSDSYYNIFIKDRFYTSQSVVNFKNHKVLGFDKDQMVKIPNPDLIVNGFCSAGGQLFYIVDNTIKYLTPDGQLKDFFKNAGFYSVYYGHPTERMMIVCLKESATNGYDRYSAPGTFYLLEYDKNYNITRNEKILSESKIIKYGLFLNWRNDSIIYSEDTDENGDGEANYKDKKNKTIKVMNLKTLDSKVFMPGKFGFRFIGAKPSKNLVLFGEEMPARVAAGLEIQ